MNLLFRSNGPEELWVIEVEILFGGHIIGPR